MFTKRFSSSAPPVVLITGCSAGGIGHSLAREFALHHCVVYATARDPAKLDPTLQSHNIHGLQLDVTDQNSIASAVDKIVAESGHIDILVNNAGQGYVTPLVEADINSAQHILDVNLVGVLRLCQSVCPLMMDRRQGVVANVGSVAAYAATPWVGIYAASKAALHALTDTLRLELRPFGIATMVVAPGSVQSELISKQSNAGLVGSRSRYINALEDIRAKAEYGKHIRQMPADVFARKVVRKILYGQSAYVTCGKFASFAWLLYYLPTSVRDFVFARAFGIRKLEKDLHR
ncbi:hypothetical protein H4R99_001433 [Coemansia sp. RSA 1722]|nr:hypothetical protein IWW45_001508 [Coemansia sp. RSA 485]KAJ2601664.1 hypothetical protein GGF39_001144 [Coemansia sp. RSA 1721]KAJ2605030.1 hypothetical protein H4R99_001433 [Coemansia sp. RSA 1722]